MKEIQENPKYLDGLDVFFFADKKSNKYEKATYFLEGGKNNRNIYICPRIWCVKCEIPISPIDFIKTEQCPKCKGGLIKDKKEKITNDNTVYVRKHTTTWRNQSQTSFLKKYLEIKGKNALKIPESLSSSQKGMYPYYIKPIEADGKIKLVCCGSKTKKLFDKSKNSNNVDINIKIYDKKKSLLKHKFLFLYKKNKLEEFRMGIPYEDINILLENTHVIELKDYKKTEMQLYKYYFKFLGKLREYKTDEVINKKKKYIRMGVINEDYFPNNSFISCLNTLLFVDKINTNNNEIKQQYILDFINDDEKFIPSLFIQILGGNLVELFREPNMLLNKNVNDKLDIFIKKYKKDLLSLGLNLEHNRELFNIYSAMNNFKEYSNNENIKKKYEYYLDFITKDNFIFRKCVNIVIIDKSDKSERSNISILCHNSNNYNDTERDTYLILKIGNYYEPLVMFEFRSKKLEAKPIMVKFNNKIVKKLLKIQSSICKTQNNKLNNLIESEVKYYIRGDYPKIIGLVLKNDVFLKINPVIIDKNYLGKIVNIKNLNREKLKEFNKTTVSSKLYNLLTPITNFSKSLDNIDDIIYNELMDKDDRVLFFRNYYNNVYELNNIVFNLNKYFTFEGRENNNKRKQIVEKILNIIKNPVLLLNNKKNKLKNIIEKEKIFDYLFNFTTKEYFYKVKLVNFYENNGKKIDISKKFNKFKR